MDLHGANQAAKSVSFAPNAGAAGAAYRRRRLDRHVQHGVSAMLTNPVVARRRKLTVLTNVGLAQYQTSTVSFLNPPTGMITFNPPIEAA